MGRGVQVEPPLPVDFLAACFTVSDAGVLVWKRRLAEHFPARTEDKRLCRPLAEQGDPNAHSAAPEQIAEAQRRAREWKPTK